MTSLRSVVVSSALVLTLALVAGLPAETAAAIPAGAPSAPRGVVPAHPVTAATAGTAGRGGGAAAAARVPHTHRQELIPMTAAECRSIRRYLISSRLALKDAACADEADKSTRLATHTAAIRILRTAGKRSPVGVSNKEMAAVAAALSIADPDFVCVKASNTSHDTKLAAPTYWDATVYTSTPACCIDWTPYGTDKCCFTSCYTMAELFPAWLSLDFCCGQADHTRDRTLVCPNDVSYVVSP